MSRRRQKMGWPMREQEFCQISDHALDTVVRNILSLSPNSGEQMVLGALRGRGILVQRNRVVLILYFQPLIQSCTSM